MNRAEYVPGSQKFPWFCCGLLGQFPLPPFALSFSFSFLFTYPWLGQFFVNYFEGITTFQRSDIFPLKVLQNIATYV